MTDVESDPGLLDNDSYTTRQKAKRRPFKRFSRIVRTDSNQESPDPPTAMPAIDPAPNGEQPHGTKHKHRIKLWDSFLQKTRQIRVRTKEKSQSVSSKLQKRTRSHPNVSSFSSAPSSPDSSDKTFSLLNSPGAILDKTGGDTADSKRDKYRQQRDTTYTRSSVSLNDSAGESVASPDKLISRVSFQKNEVAGDEGYRSFHDHSTSTTETSISKSPAMSKVNSAERSSVDTGDDKDDEFCRARQESNDDEDSVPVIEKSTIREPSMIPVGQHFTNQHSFYVLNVHLREGRDLVIRDACGTSDPYVKFKVGSKVVYKSRTIYKNLNPRWNERFSVPIEDISKPLVIKVYDYDRAWNDDPMGGVDINLTTLEANKEAELKLLLSEKGKEEYMGYLLLACVLVPKSCDDKEQFSRRTLRTPEPTKRSKMQLWNGVVNIVLVEGLNLVSMDDNGLSDPYVKFKLGLEKYKSKFKTKTLHPCWLEQFDLRLYEEQTSQLEISVFDHDSRGKDDFMGRAIIDLSQLEKERTHVLEQRLEDGAGTIKLLLTITGTIGSEISSDLTSYTPNALNRDNILSRYGFLNSFTSLNDIGHLEVKVFRAHGLQAADFGGLSDPFCVLELVNDRVQTHTEYKTLNPEWSKVFTLPVKDIHSVLEVTVYDEDRNKKVEFLGKVAIPLLKIRNGERRWYALKDRKMIHKYKGAILLEMDLVFNHIKAGVRTLNPREEKLMLPEHKFKIAIMKQNINRVSQLIGVVMETGRFVQSCFDWQSPPRTITAFIVYLVIVWNFELYMLPISLLLIFMKNLVVAQIVGSLKKEPVEDDYLIDEDDEDDDDKDKGKKQEEKRSIVDRYHAVQEVCLTVQQGLDMVASLGERIKNTFNWTVPWLSTLAVIALLAGCVVLFFIPLRFLLLAWGINKFTKKLRKPNALSNNELLDFLSRVPSDNELVQYKELRPDIPANATPNKKKRS